MKIEFDGSVRLGDIILMVSIVAGLYFHSIKMVEKIQSIETKLDVMYRWFQANIINRFTGGGGGGAG